MDLGSNERKVGERDNGLGRRESASGPGGPTAHQTKSSREDAASRGRTADQRPDLLNIDPRARHQARPQSRYQLAFRRAMTSVRPSPSGRIPVTRRRWTEGHAGAL
ncbi:hypothetical protein C8Q73DRAFT_299309 [Cubamyces lactineus]|nr:hypothetical protein C8Q73DRAFT_299309 [Cubamyces lactineus]